MFAVFATIVCLASLSHSAPLACEDLVKPLDQLDLGHLEGRWALAAGSANDSAVMDVLKRRDSIAIDFYNSTYTQANRYPDHCQYYSHNISIEDHVLKINVKTYNFTGTFFHSSCLDCVVFRLDVVSPKYDSVNIYMFRKKREVEPEYMEEFKAQVECLNLPPPVIKDPALELCPEQTTSDAAAKTAEKTEGQ